MALIYTTGTINQPDAGSVGLAMVNKIRDDLVAHEAWELVEEYTAGGGVVRWTVLKCLAAESGMSEDFHLVIGRTLSTGELRFAICEEYTAGSHTMAKYAQASGSVLYDADGCSPSTYTLSTVVFPSTGATPRYQSWTPSGTSTKWWIIAADDGCTVAFNGASNGFVHLGKYTPLTPSPITFPIQMIGLSTTGEITRNPAVAGINAVANALHIEGSGGSADSSALYQLGFMGDLRYNDKLQDNQRSMAEAGMIIYSQGAPENMAIFGYVLGKQNRMRVNSRGTPVGFAFGDAYAMNGTLWVPWKPDSGRIWDTGVASS